MTIREALKSQTFDSEVLLAHILRKDRAWLFANPYFELSSLNAERYALLAKRRSRGVPVAYLTGHKEFYGLEFKVSRSVLIPRPETELLVELAMKRIENKELRIKEVVDIGTGSGCIITALTVIARRTRRGNLKFLATDISPKALKIARINARRHSVSRKIKFIKGNLLEPFLYSKFSILNSLIIANLPYLTSAQVKSNPDLKHEPRSALAAGKDGLKYYRGLFKQMKKLTTYLPDFAWTKSRRAGNLQHTTVLLEHDPSQVSALKSLAKKYLPNSKPIFHRDLSGRYRIMEIFVYI